MKSGVLGFTYQQNIYAGEYLYPGIQAVDKDMRLAFSVLELAKTDEIEFTRDLRETVSLVVSWYADKTVRIKPDHIRYYLDEFGLESIHKSIGRHVWFTCHNPLNTLIPKGIDFSMQEGQYVHISVDKGMSWEKYKDVGGYVEVDPSIGIALRGYSDNDFTQIIDTPPTMVLSKDDDGRWFRKSMWENASVSRERFLPLAVAQLTEKIYNREAPIEATVKTLPVAFSIEQSI